MAVRVLRSGSAGRAGTQSSTARMVRRTRRALVDLFGPVDDWDHAVRLWNGTLIGSHDAPVTLVLRSPRALRQMFLPPSALAIGESFVTGAIDVEGDLSRLPELGGTVLSRLSDPVQLTRLAVRLARLPGGRRPSPARRAELAGGRHSLGRDRAAVAFHYDLPPEFWSLWLDRSLTYSCAYFVDERASLEEAQVAKFELACRKLQLSPGDRLLDIGCGWGAFVVHAARHHGVEAIGITLSEAQRDVAAARIVDAGLGDQVTIHCLDYRSLARLRREEPFDRVASLGMIEHVGVSNLDEYFAIVHGVLKPGGSFLCQSILDTGPPPEGTLRRWLTATWKEARFLDTYIYPDVETPALVDLLVASQRAGFELLDYEGIRSHYPPTFRHWRQRFDENRADVIASVGTETFRAWRLYLALAAWAFRTGRLGIGHLLLSRPLTDGDPGRPSPRRTQSRLLSG